MTATLSPPLPDRAHEVFLGELGAFLALLDDLAPAEWDLPTDCTRWSVRDMVAHVAGAMDEGAHVHVLVRHLVIGRRRYPDLCPLDGLNEVQIDDRRQATPQDLLTQLADLGPRAARARRRMPRLLRGRRLPSSTGLPAGSTLGYLVDVIYARDVWMHRIDVARATGRDLAFTTTEADVVAQVVRDLSETWDGPVTRLVLTGHGAGAWTLGTGDLEATVEADAVEVCRMLSGRDAAPEIRVTGTAEVERSLLSARVVF
jgi:uncharacterized protein (TIGR03083 family)